jgi:DNA-binding transcriptional LysR family regulator
VEIVLIDDFFGRELDRLASGEVDFAIIRSIPDERQFTFQKLLDDAFMVMVPEKQSLEHTAGGDRA